MDPGWVIWKKFRFENVMVRCSGDQMEFWSGGQKKYIAWSNKLVRGRGMYELDVLCAWMTDGCSEV